MPHAHLLITYTHSFRYGHYLMPSGRLAHFYIGDTVRKGHRVDLVQPPEVPFEIQVRP